MNPASTFPVCYDLRKYKSFSPIRHRAISLCVEMGLSAHKIYHSLAVADCAVLIAQEVEKQMGVKVDKDVCEIGALLHDIGLSQFVDDRPGHDYVGACLAMDAGFSEEIAHCIEYHDCGGLTAEYCKLLDIPHTREDKPDAIPETWEEKIVAYADQIVSQAGEWEVDVWNDDEAPAKASYGYLDAPVHYKYGRRLPYDHPQVARLCEFNKEMRRFMPRELFETLRPALDRMVEVQLAAGMPHPFPSCSEWPPKE